MEQFSLNANFYVCQKKPAIRHSQKGILIPVYHNNSLHKPYAINLASSICICVTYVAKSLTSLIHVNGLFLKSCCLHTIFKNIIIMNLFSFYEPLFHLSITL